IAREYPTWNGEPYYPVPEIEQQELYKKYEKEARKINDIYFVGRLANYRYYNMDIAIKKSLDLLKKLKL
ncbi:MAG: UDP-galactopyranose mutase, partial [bacterium]